MTYTVRVLIAVALAAFVFLLWQVKTVLLLLFGGLIIATVLGALAIRIGRWTGLSHRWATAASVLLVAALALGVLWFAGDAFIKQLDELREALPRAEQAVLDWVRTLPGGPRVLDYWFEVTGGTMSVTRVVNWAGWIISALGTFILVVMLGVFMAAEPAFYRRGIVRLFSPRLRPAIADALEASRTALGGWLMGQGISMLIVGLATWIGLMLLGVPLAFIIGVLAALLEFVPYFGPIAAGLLAVLIGFVQGPQVALYVAILMLAIQQVESNLAMPLVQRWAVRLPPVLGLVAVVIFGSLFGIVGVLLATPLMVVLMVLVQKLYVKDWLEGERPDTPPRMAEELQAHKGEGEDQGRGRAREEAATGP